MLTEAKNRKQRREELETLFSSIWADTGEGIKIPNGQKPLKKIKTSVVEMLAVCRRRRPAASSCLVVDILDIYAWQFFSAHASIAIPYYW